MSFADTLTLIWTLCVSSFLGFSISSLLMSRSDRIEIEHPMPGIDSITQAESIFLVESRERRNLIRVIGWSLFLIVGVAAFLPLDRQSTSLITIGGLFVGMIALGAEDVIELVDRLRFRRLPR